MRLLLLEVPRLLRELLEQAIRSDGDCELLNDVDHVPVETAVPDVVILGLTAREDATLVPALFGRWPQAQVMTVMPAGDATMMYELSLRAHVLQEMSPGEVIETLRNTIRPLSGSPRTIADVRPI